MTISYGGVRRHPRYVVDQQGVFRWTRRAATPKALKSKPIHWRLIYFVEPIYYRPFGTSAAPPPPGNTTEYQYFARHRGRR